MLDESQRYRGTSADGATLEAEGLLNGTTGTITTADVRQLGFTVHRLALADPAVLARHGLPQEYRKYAADNQVPGEYVAVIAPGGTHWFGRDGDVRGGQPGSRIIGLDKEEFKK